MFTQEPLSGQIFVGPGLVFYMGPPFQRNRSMIFKFVNALYTLKIFNSPVCLGDGFGSADISAVHDVPELIESTSVLT